MHAIFRVVQTLLVQPCKKLNCTYSIFVERMRRGKARGRTNRRYRYRGVVNEAERARNREKSKVRSCVEHVIGVIKLKFGFTKIRYRGLEKNANRLFATFGLTNLYVLRHRFRTE
jgi:IS5 family transposase